jgi:hypothetical protein
MSHTREERSIQVFHLFELDGKVANISLDMKPFRVVPNHTYVTRIRQTVGKQDWLGLTNTVEPRKLTS